jgi:hypothetical protein
MSKDFTPITLAATFPTVIMIHPSVSAKNVQEFVALVKSQPGKLAYSSAGTGNGDLQSGGLPVRLSLVRRLHPRMGRRARSADRQGADDGQGIHRVAAKSLIGTSGITSRQSIAYSEMNHLIRNRRKSVFRLSS